MSQMCPNCSHDNLDEAKNCTICSAPLRGLLGENAVLGDRYKVTSVLGCGAMGAVYLAEDQRLAGRRTAIKQNRPDPTATVEVRSQSREQFLAEAHVLARLDHPSLPKVSDYFVEEDNEFLVMDYVEGEDLDSLLQRNGQPLPVEQVLPWIDQVLDGLAYLHNQKPQPIIHRDIKPANIRLNLAQNRVKLVDFGLVKLYDADNPETKLELRGVGTPAYAPLEQFATSEQHTDSRSDIYALGATMYHLLTNLFPPDVHQRVLDPEILTPPRQLNAQLSETVERVIRRAMEIHPDQRYQTAEKMREALAEKDSDPTVLSPSAAAGIMSPLLFTALGAMVVLVLLVGATYWLFFRSDGVETPPASPAIAVEALTATSTRESVAVQGFSDAPTDAPTPTTPPTEEAPTATPTIEEATPEPEPTATLTSQPTPTSAPARVVPPANDLTGSLSGTIAYPVFNGTDFDIYFGQADGTGTQLYRRQASQPAFSPDGARIAFHSWRLDAWGLMVMPVLGGEPILVAHFVEDQLPTWMPDGKEIYFLSRRDGDRKSRLRKVGSAQVKAVGVVVGEGEYPTIGRSGSLVFRGWGSTGVGIRLSANPLNDVQTITDSDNDTAPALSPDGQKIAFMSRRTGNWEIYVVNTDGSDPQRLTDNPGDDGLPTWSPDSQAIAFITNREGNWSIRATTVDGSDQQQLFEIQGSPDGFVGNDINASRGWLEERISWTAN